MKLAILAGATSRIGEAIARRLATERHSRPDRTQRRSTRYRARRRIWAWARRTTLMSAPPCVGQHVRSRTGRDNSLSNGQTIDPGLIIGSRMDRLANIAAFVRGRRERRLSPPAARHLNVCHLRWSATTFRSWRIGWAPRLLNRTTRKVSLTEIGREILRTLRPHSGRRSTKGRPHGRRL